MANPLAMESATLRRRSCSGPPEADVACGHGEIAAGTAASTVSQRLAELAPPFGEPAGIPDPSYSLFTDYPSSREAAAGNLGLRALTVEWGEDEELGAASASLWA